MRAGKPKLTDVEQKAFEVGDAAGPLPGDPRQGDLRRRSPCWSCPDPANPATLAYSAEAYKKAEEQGPRSLGPARARGGQHPPQVPQRHPDQGPGDARRPTPKFDARYTAWLKEKSAWVPLGVIREVPVEELAKAGFPAAKVEAFRAAFKAMEDEELANPGQAAEQARAGPDRGRRATWASRSTPSSIPTPDGDGPRGPLQRARPVLQGPDRLRRWACWP